LDIQPFSKIGRDIDGELTCVEEVAVLRRGMVEMCGMKRLPI
jgi:hypothetical protein